MLLLASPNLQKPKSVSRAAAHLHNPPIQTVLQPVLHRPPVAQVRIDAGGRHGIVELVRDLGAAHCLFVSYGLVQAIDTNTCGTLERVEDSHAVRAVDPLVWLVRGIPKEEGAKVPSNEVFPHGEEYQPLPAGRGGAGLLMIPPGCKEGSGTLGLSANDDKLLAGPYNFSTSVST